MRTPGDLLPKYRVSMWKLVLAPSNGAGLCVFKVGRKGVGQVGHDPPLCWENCSVASRLSSGTESEQSGNWICNRKDFRNLPSVVMMTATLQAPLSMVSQRRKPLSSSLFSMGWGMGFLTSLPWACRELAAKDRLCPLSTPRTGAL